MPKKKLLKYTIKYLQHLLCAVNTKGHGVHSPSVFQFLYSVLYNKNEYYIFQEIDKLRNELLKDKRKVFIKDFGTGKDRFSTVGGIVRTSVQSPKYSKLLFRIISHTGARKILELGTSAGLTTAYLASVSSTSECITLEGSSEVLKIAGENFKKLNIKNIITIEGDINDTLPEALAKLSAIDFIFVDANHSSGAVLSYLDQCLPYLSANAVIVFDDIHWSDDMEQAWKVIKDHPKVTSTIDLFQMGIVFFNPVLNKKHYKVCY